MTHAITDTTNDLATRLDHLAGELTKAGVLTDPAWRDALHAVPRHRFIPTRAWIYRDGKVIGLDLDRDPRPWWDAVYSPSTPIITQFDDRSGPPAGNGSAEPSSSCPAPTIQLQLLHALDVADGMRVLEIGTGTGWNAALLAHRLGNAAVVSVEIDPAVAGQAIKALAASRQLPKVECADGSHGYPLGAPYDRIIATCTVHQIPPAWIAQTRPGGIILAPWAPPAAGNGDLLVRLTVNPDQTASGPFLGAVSFMTLRAQRHTSGQRPPGIWDPPPAGTATSTTTIDPVAALTRGEAAFLTRLSLGQAAYNAIADQPDGRTLVWLSDPASSSWARIHTHAPTSPSGPPEATHSTVEQYGQRHLWDEIETVHHWWRQAGQPSISRFGLTVTPHAHTVWLDDPTQTIFTLTTPQPPAFIGAAR